MSGGIRLSSLQRAAQAMDCKLVYAFVPNESLTHTVEQQARHVYIQQMNRVRQTMALEDQESDMPSPLADAELQAIIDSGAIWSNRGAKK